MKAKYKVINNIDIKSDINIIDFFFEKKSFKQMYNDADQRIKKENEKFIKNFRK